MQPQKIVLYSALGNSQINVPTFMSPEEKYYLE